MGFHPLEKLELLERRAANDKLRDIDDAYPYLRSLLRDDAVGARSRPGDPLAASSPPPVPAPGATEIPEQGGAGDLIRAMKRAVEQLDPVQRQGWVDRALQEPAAKGLLTAVISRRASQGDVLHGLLGSVVVHTYATATYGPACNSPG